MNSSAGGPDSSRVADRQRAATRVGEDHFRRCFELSLIGMAVTSPGKGILEINEELCRILGYERSELLQAKWSDFMHPADLAGDLAQFDRMLAGEIDGYVLDKRWNCKDGRIVNSIMAVRCQRGADGAVDYCVGLVQDITERKRAETEYQQQLRDLTMRLIEAQETESKHLARELHDVFSQQLAVIGLELTRLAGAMPHSARALAGPLGTVIGQIGTLAEDLHGISRRLHPAILDDLGLPAAIRSECLAFSDRHGLPVAFMCDEVAVDIPEGVALCLYRIAQEGLRNIGKHAGVCRVSVQLSTRGRDLVLSIADTGAGVDVQCLTGKRVSGWSASKNG
jgi:PAS domain S-box-containing protein